LGSQIIGAADSEDEADRLAISAAFSPSSASADARVIMTESFVTGGAIDVDAAATTDLSIGAGAAPFALTFAATQTDSLVDLQQTLLDATGLVTVDALSWEKQTLAARADAQSTVPVDVAATLSLRKASSDVVIRHNTRSAIDAGNVGISAQVERDLVISARSYGTQSDVVSVSGVLSFAQAQANVVLAGDVLSGGTLSVLARVLNKARVTSVASGGGAFMAGQGGEDRSGADGAFGDILRAGADTLGGKAGDTGVSEDTAQTAAQVGASVVVLLEEDSADVQIGGTVQTQSGSDEIYAVDLTADRIDLFADVDHSGRAVRTGALIEADEAAPGVAVSAAVSVLDLDSRTRVTLDRTSRMSGVLSGGAATRFRTVPISLRAQAAGFTPSVISSLPDVTAGIADDQWLLAQQSRAVGDAVGVGINAGIVLLTTDNEVRLDGTVVGDDSSELAALSAGTAAISVGALKSGGALGAEFATLSTQNTGDSASVGAGVSVLLADERNAMTIGKDAVLWARGGSAVLKLGARAEAQYANVALSSSEGGTAGVDAGIAVSFLDKQTLATLDPLAAVTGALEVFAQDSGAIVTSGLAETKSSGVGVGVGVALGFVDSKTSAIIGARTADGGAVIGPDRGRAQFFGHSIKLTALSDGAVITIARALRCPTARRRRKPLPGRWMAQTVRGP